ncbi:methylated-DNA--[protein]-cysteine S-methyltransferase [Lachnospiraceae bacterium]|nr:methylated-DNA--[protein]-cysteine S-methyltransferase [Lachnospiraceae bacterium]
MQYISYYRSPGGELLLTGDEIGLDGLWFQGEKYLAKHSQPQIEEKELPSFVQTKQWLDVYFSGREPGYMPPLHLKGTPFQMEVWKILQKIPYGKTVSYGEIAREIAKQRGIARMSAQAVGGAVGRNKVSIIVPCHRVIGADGSLTGYAGGLEKKRWLLDLEGILL